MILLSPPSSFFSTFSLALALSLSSAFSPLFLLGNPLFPLWDQLWLRENPEKDAQCSLCIYRYMDIHRTPHLYMYTYFRLAHMYARQISHRMQCELKARHLENAMCMYAMSHTHKTFKRTQQLRATVLNRFVDNDTSLFAACNLQSLLLFFCCFQM